MKRLLIAALIVGLVGLLAACSTAVATHTPTPPTSSPSTALPATEPVEESTTQEPDEEPTMTSQPATNTPANTGTADADVTHVRAVQESNGTWTFYVTVEHPDTGWEDYADGWDVVLSDGTVLKPNPDDAFTRVLLHPHENEQPFTRNQRGIEIPDSVTQVTVRAHDIVDGFGGQTVTVDLTVESGENFEVER